MLTSVTLRMTVSKKTSARNAAPIWPGISPVPSGVALIALLLSQAGAPLRGSAGHWPAAPLLPGRPKLCLPQITSGANFGHSHVSRAASMLKLCCRRPLQTMRKFLKQ